MSTNFRIFIIRFRRIISAFSAGLGVLLLISIIRSTTPTVLAASPTADLPAGHKISSSDLTTHKIAKSFAWANLVTKRDGAIGKITTHAIAKGQPLSYSDLITSDLLTGFGPDQNAIAIPITSKQLNAFLTAGNHIDVYASANGEPAALVAHDAVVIFVPASKSGTFGFSGAEESSLILAVNSSQSAGIASYIGAGVFSFVLLAS